MVLRGNHSSGFGLSTVSLVLLSLSLGACLMPVAAGQSRPTNHRSASSPVDQWMKEGQDLAAQGRFAEAEVPLKHAAYPALETHAVLTLLGKVEGRVGKH